MITFFWNKIAF